ncbi:sulfate adenylyltransferase subunit CysN [Granulicella cerasi]|uniref:sulfate adenylyltransferase n=1 Tax=Granulicella cerasi TaxID=741063 RepID=A0ABW1Z786_9BACT|nr:sulfate adenylyltransferase subunit CysN [Granulicella cerasi]
MSTTTLNLTDAQHEQRFRTFLDAHLDQEMLRFTTAGSVDDGKSTLIGRLLHDTKSVYEDQLATIRASRVNRAGEGRVDLSLLTDGLKAEREQGITIDVAYRYFSTSKRKFIIADTPGHEQYTRNMATGASTADVAIVLIDANAFAKAGGLLPQSRRHTYIASLLRIPHVVAAVNKMDLVGYSEEVYAQVKEQFTALATKLGIKSMDIVPVSALAGDNVVDPSTNMPWYTGKTLLEYLETVPLKVTDEATEPLRFPVQLVVRPDMNFRGFAGRVERGEVRAGQKVKALPSGRTTRVKSIVTYDGELKSAASPRSITIELEDEIDLSRGEMLIAENEVAPSASTAFRTMIVWMHETPLRVGKTYLAKHTTRTVRATVKAIRYRVNVNTTEHVDAAELQMNDIAEVEFETSLPLFFDAYAESRGMGSLILIDPVSNATVGAAMIIEATEASSDDAATGFAFVALRGDAAAARRIAEVLASQHQQAVIIDDVLIDEASIVSVARALQLAGVVAITSRSLDEATTAKLRDLVGDAFIESAEAAEERFVR